MLRLELEQNVQTDIEEVTVENEDDSFTSTTQGRLVTFYRSTHFSQ